MILHRHAALGAALLLALGLFGLAGCQAEKTAATAPAAMSAPAPAATPGLSDEAILARIKPYLDCAYARYVAAQAGRKTFRPEAAEAACAACSSLLEPFREFVYDRSGSKEYVVELTDMVREHALTVMREASAR